MSAKIEFGDFQTPLVLAEEICSFLSRQGIAPEIVIEPTCGLGSFLLAAANFFTKAKLFGFDINAEYVESARRALAAAGAASRATIETRDFFKHNWTTELQAFNGQLLVLGNLPWVTNATLSTLNAGNLPTKSNFQGFRGIEARTGKSNFDISEWMLIQLAQALRGKQAMIAMLCKTAIARKLLRFAWQNDGRILNAALYKIDAKKHFGASVNACLLLLHTGPGALAEAKVFENLGANSPSRILGLAGQDLVSDVRSYRKLQHLEGLCPYQWRSGVKHDCSSVMELRRNGGNHLQNKFGEKVELEPNYLFPLLKCSDLANGCAEPERVVLVTQTRIGEDTSVISANAPRTWNYLQSHKKLFDGRKSSIYSNRIPFALFGVGDYSFAPWKVAISGLHKSPRFVFVKPFQNKPVLFDDTCYFLPFEIEDEAKVVTEILNSEPCLQFIASLLFEDSKRPITVDLLERLNIHAIAEEAGLLDQWTLVRNQKHFNPEGQTRFQAEFIMEQAIKS